MSIKYENLREEEIKNKVAVDFFDDYDHTQIVGNIDFCIAAKDKDKAIYLFDDISKPSLLWAEAKKGIVKDINESFVQLILTIGKARTFDNNIPPNFIGAFDAEKIAFLPYYEIQDIFNQNDFNWNVTPSNHGTKEFLQLYNLVKDILNSQTLLFNFIDNESELKQFIKLNFKTNSETLSKIKVNKNNFTFVYQKWCKSVMPTISVDWNIAKKAGLIDADFFLADLLSKENKTLKDKLFVLLQDNRYILDRKIDETGFETSKQATFKDNQKAHNLFWNLYERPPKKEYWNYIIERRDLLVPQDVRERKGSFFTPQIWVEKSQQYIADVLGDDWQDNYYVWDCCAGTGNLLNGLTNKRNIFASTLDTADIDVIKDRINNGACLFEDHIFQFDFLNDDFIPISKGGKLPDKLYEIISNEEQRKKLVIYINPPYAEATSTKTVSKTGNNKENVSNTTKTWNSYISSIDKSARELFVQFFIRIYMELQGCFLCEFSKTKMIQSPNFKSVRKVFTSKHEKSFVVPSDSFDNVKGKFPIGFFIWNTSIKENIQSVVSDIYDKDGSYCGKKNVICYENQETINQWLKKYIDTNITSLAFMCCKGTDFQNKNFVNIAHETMLKGVGNAKGITKFKITKSNFIESCIYFSTRLVMEQSWLNDRDQFLYPNDKWKNDKNFQTNCIVYTLFSGQNRISSSSGTNHFIPFTEEQVGINHSFESHFMSDFINGKIKDTTSLFSTDEKLEKLTFSSEAQDVYDAGLKLWQYYHTKQDANVNASLYDIREYFQGRNSNGKMNSDSNDEYYTELIKDLRNKQKNLAKKIEPKVYEYGFLR